jgi:hypothetical protein
MIACLDLKTGFVSKRTDYQIAAYSLPGLHTYPHDKPIPVVEEGLILKVNEDGCKPIRISPERLKESQELFLAALKLYKDAVKHGITKPKGIKDLYYLDLFEAQVSYPRVTSILKVLSEETLEKWKRTQAISYTLKEMIRTQRTPEQVLSAFEAELFDPLEGALAHRDRRGNEGTDLHRLVRNYLTGLPTPLDAESEWIQTVYPKFVHWATAHRLSLVEGISEMKLYHPEYKFAGTCDAYITWEPSE